MKIRVDPGKCVPLRELERDFYDQSNYIYLKRTISRDGYNDAYPVRAIHDPKTRMLLVFDGIHRTMVSKSLGLEKIPVIVEDITKATAIAEGYKANRTHAWYNTLDKARHLDALANACIQLSKNKTVGRPGYLHEVSRVTGEDVRTIKRHIRLLKLPDKVQQMIGKGDLGYTKAVTICTLLGTEKEHLIEQVAEKARNMSTRETESYVQAILKGIQHPFKACDLCGRGYPKEKMSGMKFCPQCTEKLRRKYFTPEDYEPVEGTRISTEELLRRIEKSRNKEKLRNGFQVSDSETPFMDYVKRLEEVNEVRNKMGLQPLKELVCSHVEQTSPVT